MQRLVLSVILASAAVLAAAVPAPAAVTIGSNLASDPMLNQNCNIPCTTANLALIPANSAPGGVTSPVNGTVTSFSVRSGSANPNAVALRVLHPEGGLNYTGAGTTSLVSIGTGITGPIATNLPIEAGDAIGLDSPNGNLVLAANPGATQIFWSIPPLAEGSTRPGLAGGAYETMVQATIEPDNSLDFGKLKRKQKKGIAKLKITVPNAGVLRFAGKKVKVAGGARTIDAPGEITVKVKAKGKKLRLLKKNNKVTVKPLFFFTPTNGTENRQPRKLKLKKKPKR